MALLYSIDQFANPVSGAAILDILDTPTGTGTLAGNFFVSAPESYPIILPTNLGDLITQKYAGMLAAYSNFTRVTFDDLLDATGVDLAASAGMFGSRSAIKVNPDQPPYFFGTHGSINGTAVLTDTTVNFVTAGVVAGDAVTITSGSGAGRYTVLIVTTTTLTVSAPLSPPASSVHYQISHTSVFQSVSEGLTGSAPEWCVITWEVFSVTQSDPYNGTISRTYQQDPSDTAHFLCSVSFNGGVTWLPTTDSTLLYVPPVDQGTQFIIQLTNSTSPPVPLFLASWAMVY